MSDTITPTPNEVLQSLLKAHGYKATISEERVMVIDHLAQMSSDVYLRSQAAPFQLQLDVRVHLPDGRTLVESFAGIGQSAQFALGDGFDNFSCASFHVLLHAFFQQPDDTAPRQNTADDESEEWQLSSGRFNVYIGNATFRGEPPVQGEEIVRWFEVFAHAIQRAALNPHQSHWIRLYYAQGNGEMLNCEVLLDNEIWPETQNQMAGYSWPTGKAFYSARIFLVLQPCADTKRS